MIAGGMSVSGLRSWLYDVKHLWKMGNVWIKKDKKKKNDRKKTKEGISVC